jgi:hypothetical protein
MLKKDHEEVKGILRKLKETKESEMKKREELFLKLRIELVPHMKKPRKAPFIHLDGAERGSRARAEPYLERKKGKAVAKTQPQTKKRPNRERGS